MRAVVEFVVYGQTLVEFEAEAIAKLAALGDSDQMWDIRYDVSPAVSYGTGVVGFWQATVYAVTKTDNTADGIGYWRDGS